MPKSIVRTMYGVGIEAYGESQDNLVLVHSLYNNYILTHRRTLNKESLKNPPFTTRRGGDSSKQSFVLFIPNDKEGAMLKALHEVGAACSMWSGFGENSKTLFLVDEPDVAERAAKMAGVELSKEDYITIIFTDEGLQEASLDDSIGLVDVRGVGESLIFAIGFLHLLESEGWTYPALPERFFSPQEFNEFKERSKLESELVSEYNDLALSQYAE